MSCYKLSVLAHFRRARGTKERGEGGEGERFRVRNLAGRLVYARRTCRVKNLESENEVGASRCWPLTHSDKKCLSREASAR